MRIAILSDIHSNHYALKACLDWIDANGVDGLLFLGDYVSDCPCPQKTMALLQEAITKYEAWLVRGNREELMVDKSLDKFEWNSHQGSLKYTYENLTKENIQFFQSLPLIREVQIEGYSMVSMAHGDLHKSRNKICPDNKAMKALVKEMKGSFHICGHSHMPFICKQDNKIILNPGSVGVPVSGYPKTEMSVIESDGGMWKPTLYRMDYDVESTIQEFYTSGLAKYAGVWARCVMALLRTGRHYCEECINLISVYVKETGKDFNDPELWERAAKELGI